MNKGEGHDCKEVTVSFVKKEKEKMMNEVKLNFLGLGIAPRLLDALERLKFETPTPIQHKAIPIALEGKDVIGIAQTGTGKTIAFGIPMVQRLANERGPLTAPAETHGQSSRKSAIGAVSARPLCARYSPIPAELCAFSRRRFGTPMYG